MPGPQGCKAALSNQMCGQHAITEHLNYDNDLLTSSMLAFSSPSRLSSSGASDSSADMRSSAYVMRM